MKVDYFYNLCGFYVIEHAVSSRYQQLALQQEVQSWWTDSCRTLTKRIQKELLPAVKLPTELIEIKNNVWFLSKAILNYDLKADHMLSFLEELRLEFEKRLILMLEKNVKKILMKDKFQPFTVQNIDDFECIAAYNLDVVDIGNDGVNANGNRVDPRDLDGDGDSGDDERGGVMAKTESDFPLMVPFSVSVPMICGYLDDLISYYEDYRFVG